MQQAEKRLVIEQVCGTIMRDHPDMFIVTINDAVLCHKENCPHVTDVFKEKFAAWEVAPRIEWKDVANH